jgi:hypothetical protein
MLMNETNLLQVSADHCIRLCWLRNIQDNTATTKYVKMSLIFVQFKFH